MLTLYMLEVYKKGKTPKDPPTSAELEHHYERYVEALAKGKIETFFPVNDGGDLVVRAITPKGDIARDISALILNKSKNLESRLITINVHAVPLTSVN